MKFLGEKISSLRFYVNSIKVILPLKYLENLRNMSLKRLYVYVLIQWDICEEKLKPNHIPKRPKPKKRRTCGKKKCEI